MNPKPTLKKINHSGQSIFYLHPILGLDKSGPAEPGNIKQTSGNSLYSTHSQQDNTKTQSHIKLILLCPFKISLTRGFQSTLKHKGAHRRKVLNRNSCWWGNSNCETGKKLHQKLHFEHPNSEKELKKEIFKWWRASKERHLLSLTVKWLPHQMLCSLCAT